MKRLIFVLSIPVILLGCSNPQTQVNTDIEVPVSVEEVNLKTIEEYVVTTGTVNASKDFILKSENAGFYRRAINPRTSQPYTLGDLIKKDEVIVYLDNPEQENSIRIESLTLNLDISKNEFEKQQSLYEKGGVTLRELKNSEISYINAKYNYDNALMQLAKLKVIAPFDGIIVDITYYTEGVKIASGSEIARVMNYSLLTMDVSLPGNLLGQVNVDQPTRVVNYTIPDKILTGKITQVSPALDSETRTFKATVNIGNPELVLRPGMFVKAEIIIARKDSTIVIPKDIMLSRRNRKSVFIVDREFARERIIYEGLQNPDEIEIIKGLQRGERLVVSGFETLRDGSRVKIVQ